MSYPLHLVPLSERANRAIRAGERAQARGDVAVAVQAYARAAGLLAAAVLVKRAEPFAAVRPLRALSLLRDAERRGGPAAAAWPVAARAYRALGEPQVASAFEAAAELQRPRARVA